MPVTIFEKVPVKRQKLSVTKCAREKIIKLKDFLFYALRKKVPVTIFEKVPVKKKIEKVVSRALWGVTVKKKKLWSRVGKSYVHAPWM